MDYDYQAVFKEMKHKKLTEYITYDFELDEKKLRRDVARGDVKIEYKSPIFDAIKQMKVKWFMTVRPNCQGNKNLGVYFNVIDEDEDKESKRRCDADIQFSLKNGKTCKNTRLAYIMDYKTGQNDFVSHKDLFNPKNGYFENGKMIVQMRGIFSIAGEFDEEYEAMLDADIEEEMNKQYEKCGIVKAVF